MKKIYILIILLIPLIFLSIFLAKEAKAGAGHNVSGWAWSENIGWISFNCNSLVDTNGDGICDEALKVCDGGTNKNKLCNPGNPEAVTCPGANCVDACSVVNYGVNINPSTGVFSGSENYAWSENIGWIAFADYNGDGVVNSSDNICPSGTCQAKLDFLTKQVSGWAKVLSHDGINWPTWIRLRGQTTETPPTDYGVWWDPPDNQELKGWAWGDVGVGWMSFNCENCEGTTCGTYPTCDNPAHPDYKVIVALDTIPPRVGAISPNVARVNVSTNFSAGVSDNVEVTNCWLYVDGANKGEMTLSLSPCPSCTATKSHTFTSTGDYSLYAFCKDEAGNYTGGPAVTVTVTEFGPLICNVSVQNTAVVNQLILINVSGSQGGISGVRFSSDNILNGTSDGNWDPSPPNYYDWNVSSGNWSTTTKTMKWSFANPDNYEVWTEIKDGAGNTRSCYDTILIMECRPGQTKTCPSPQGCTHTITCQLIDGTWKWPSCPTDICTANTQDSILCPCPGIDGCVGNDYYDYPPYGDCNNYCSCNVGTASGQPCAPTIYTNDSRCVGVDQCNSNADCDDGNPCTQNICNNPEATDSFCSYPNLAAGTNCGICKKCDGYGNCINQSPGYNDCGLGCQGCIYGFCQDYSQACAGSEASCECRSDSCIDCSTYYDGDCGYQGICHCGQAEKPVWSCVAGKCECSCEFDLSCTWTPVEPPEVIIYPPSQEVEPGRWSEFYEITIINPSGETVIYTITGSVPPDWDYQLDTASSISVTIGPGQSETVTFKVKPLEEYSSGEYDISVTAQNEESGTGWAKAVIPNQPPYKPTPSAEYPGGVSWDHCSVQALSIPIFHWIYSDPENDLHPGTDLQSAYEIRIDDEQIFFDGDELIGFGGASPSFTPSTSDWRDWEKRDWNKNYWWIIKVKDSNGNWSDWSDPTDPIHPSLFTTPLHAGPWPDFTPSKERVSQKESVTFIDNSQCYLSGDTAVPCQSPEVTSYYAWDFNYNEPTFDPDSWTKGSPTRSYADLGAHRVRLQITDDLTTCGFDCKPDGQPCVTVTLPLPKWKEIAPF